MIVHRMYEYLLIEIIIEQNKKKPDGILTLLITRLTRFLLLFIGIQGFDMQHGKAGLMNGIELNSKYIFIDCIQNLHDNIWILSSNSRTIYRY